MGWLYGLVEYVVLVIKVGNMRFQSLSEALMALCRIFPVAKWSVHTFLVAYTVWAHTVFKNN